MDSFNYCTSMWGRCVEGKRQFVDVSYIIVFGVGRSKSNIFHSRDVVFKEDKEYHFVRKPAVHTKLTCTCATNRFVVVYIFWVFFVFVVIFLSFVSGVFCYFFSI